MSFALTPTSSSSPSSSFFWGDPICNVEPCHSGLDCSLIGNAAIRWRFLHNQIRHFPFEQSPKFIRSRNEIQNTTLTIFNYTCGKITQEPIPFHENNNSTRIRFEYKERVVRIDFNPDYEFVVFQYTRDLNMSWCLFFHQIQFNQPKIESLNITSDRQCSRTGQVYKSLSDPTSPVAAISLRDYETLMTNSRVDIQGPAIFICASIEHLDPSDRACLFPVVHDSNYFQNTLAVTLYSFDNGKNFYVCNITDCEFDYFGNVIYTLEHSKTSTEVFKLILGYEKAELICNGVVMFTLTKTSPLIQGHWLQRFQSTRESLIHALLPKPESGSAYDTNRTVRMFTDGFAPFLREIPGIFTHAIAEQQYQKYVVQIKLYLNEFIPHVLLDTILEYMTQTLLDGRLKRNPSLSEKPAVKKQRK